MLCVNTYRYVNTSELQENLKLLGEKNSRLLFCARRCHSLWCQTPAGLLWDPLSKSYFKWAARHLAFTSPDEVFAKQWQRKRNFNRGLLCFSVSICPADQWPSRYILIKKLTVILRILCLAQGVNARILHHPGCLLYTLAYRLLFYFSLQVQIATKYSTSMRSFLTARCLLETRLSSAFSIYCRYIDNEKVRVRVICFMHGILTWYIITSKWFSS